MSIRLLFTATIASIGLVAACTPRPSKPPMHHEEEALRSTGHWIKSVELRQIMQRFETERLSQWPQEIEDIYEEKAAENRRRRFEEIETLALQLAEDARSLPQEVRAVAMSESDRRSFTAQCETLEEWARRAVARASNQDLDGVRTAFGEIEATCNSCHSRFREVAGPL